jgi:hypothetical protein
MGRVRVVQSWILSFTSVETTIEARGLSPHLWHQVAAKEIMEVLWFFGFRLRKHVLVHNLLDRLGLHVGYGLDVNVT